MRAGAHNQSPPAGLYNLYSNFYKSYCPDKTADGATILADFRNGVVHGNRAIKPGDKRNRPKLDEDGSTSNPSVPFGIMLEAQQFGLWCLEIVLLHIFGYTGRYDNRLTRRDEDSPPWMKDWWD